MRAIRKLFLILLIVAAQGIDRVAVVGDDALSPRVGIARTASRSIGELGKRFDRIGADWEYVVPEAELNVLNRYDIICFVEGWGELDGLAGLAATYRAYLEQGGSLFFGRPDVTGGPHEFPALQLLPYPLHGTSRFGAQRSNSVVRYHPGKPHPLTTGLQANDLPFPYGLFVELDSNWQVLAQSTGREREAAVVVASLGEGRILVHTGRDNDRHYWTDAMVVRVVKWLAGWPDESIVAGGEQLGPRRWPEYVVRLKKDYERLIATESFYVREALERARTLLEVDAQQSKTWTAYTEALRLVTERRSKAAIPMLLALLADDRLSHDNYADQVYQTFELLTGTRVIGDNPEAVAMRWWFPQSEQIEVSLAAMSDEQVQFVVDRLLEIVARQEPSGMVRKPPLTAGTINAVLQGGFRLYAGHYRNVLDKCLLPKLLALAESPQSRWLLIGPLAGMYHLRRASELELIRDDPSAPTAQRVVAAAAIYRATKKVEPAPLLDLFRTARDLDLQQVMLWLLGQSDDPGAVEAVVGSLQSDRPALREVALLVVAPRHSPEAVHPLGQLIWDRWRTGQSASDPIRAMNQLQDRSVAVELVPLMQRISQQDPNADVLDELLSLFSRITREHFAGRSRKDRVTQAISWWQED